MKRREFLGMSSIAGAAAAASVLTGKTNAAENSSKISGRPTSPIYDRLEKQIDKIRAFNQHIHVNSEADTINGYHPHRTVGKTNWRSRGMIEGLAKLLDMSPQQISDKKNIELVRQKYAKLCETISQKEYYTRLADITGCSHICFMTFPSWKFNEVTTNDRLKCNIYIEHYMFPLNNSDIAKRNPACAQRIGGVEWRIKEDEDMLGITNRPTAFQDYLDFIVRALEEHIAKPYHIGAKWGFAYYRSLFIDTVEKNVAKKIYEAQDSSPENYKKLQDYIAFHILKTLADRQFSLQIHTGLGADAGLTLNDSNASYLDLLMSRPELQHAKVAILHGSYPYTMVPAVMARRKNVWADFTWMVEFLGPYKLAEILKEWLEIAGPDKLIFGVDGCGLSQIAGTWCARKAVGIALTKMVEEEMYTEAEAIDAARKVLAENALGFYKSQL